MENNSIDLRSVIGWFFMIVSVLLLIASFTNTNGSEVNRITGITFLIFAVVMFSLARLGKKKAKSSEQAER